MKITTENLAEQLAELERQERIRRRARARAYELVNQLAHHHVVDIPRPPRVPRDEAITVRPPAMCRD